MTSVNGYSNYSQSGMYIPSYMQTPGTTTTTTNTTTTTTSEKKGGVGMGTVLLAGAVILGGIITFKNGGLKNTFKQIGKLFGKNADDAAKNLNLLEKGKALFKGTNAKKGTDAIGEALKEASTRAGKKKWFSDEIITNVTKDATENLGKNTSTKDAAKDVAEEAKQRIADEKAAKEFAEKSQKDYFGRVDQTTGKSAKDSAAVFEEAAKKEVADVNDKLDRYNTLLKKYQDKGDTKNAELIQSKINQLKQNNDYLNDHNLTNAEWNNLFDQAEDKINNHKLTDDEWKNLFDQAEAKQRVVDEKAAKEFAEKSQKDYFGRVDQTTGKSAKDSAAVFEEAAKKEVADVNDKLDRYNTLLKKYQDKGDTKNAELIQSKINQLKQNNDYLNDHNLTNAEWNNLFDQAELKTNKNDHKLSDTEWENLFDQAEAKQRVVDEKAAKEFAEKSQKDYFGRVDQTTGKSAKDSAAVFEEAAEKAKYSLQKDKEEALAAIEKYGKNSSEGKEAASDLVKIENELKSYTIE